jgi:hypothetical protein
MRLLVKTDQILNIFFIKILFSPEPHLGKKLTPLGFYRKGLLENLQGASSQNQKTTMFWHRNPKFI